MKRFFKGLYMSLGMFCAIPLPFHIWDDKAVNLVLPFFPIIGGLIGVLWWVIAKLLIASGLHIMILCAIVALIPFLVSGFLHLDGYMDTSDAILSRRPIEDKLRILKDPHTGSFAVIMLGVLFILQFACVYGIVEMGKNLVLLIFIPIISRCCSGLSILCLKPLTQSSYANMFKQNTGIGQKVFIVIVMILAMALSYFFADFSGLIIVVSVIIAFVCAMVWAYSNLKGISGDLAGFALVISELCGLAVMAII